MRRHVIIEGPDGAGKTTLLRRLVESRDYRPASRASESRTGPVSNLSGWVLGEEKRMVDNPHHPFIYDRHPIISELIYGPIVRGGVAEREFADTGWITTRKLFLHQHALVIWCLPDIITAKGHLDPTRDMPGVIENFPTICMRYREEARMWRGPALFCDPLTNSASSILVAHDFKVNE